MLTTDAKYLIRFLLIVFLFMSALSPATALAKILVIYTGGTIGSIQSASGLTPAGLKRFKKIMLAAGKNTHITITPHNIRVPLGASRDKNVGYDIVQTPRLIDSSNLIPTDWQSVLDIILKNYNHYNGFVILHGTDTLSWTASALSYLLTYTGHNVLNKPIVVTGSQRPLSYLSNRTLRPTDAMQNLIQSAYFADTAGPHIPEVVVVFHGRIMRGNATFKVNSVRNDAFHTPNQLNIGQFSNKCYSVNNSYTYAKKDNAKPLPPATGAYYLTNPKVLKAVAQNSKNVMQYYLHHTFITLVLFPGIQTSRLVQLLGKIPDLKGLILLTYGIGNAPSNPNFDKDLAALAKKGIVIVDTTQVLSGGVRITHYAVGSALKEAGAISGLTLTPSASLVKLIYLSGLNPNNSKKVKQLMQKPLAGDLPPKNTL